MLLCVALHTCAVIACKQAWELETDDDSALAYVTTDDESHAPKWIQDVFNVIVLAGTDGAEKMLLDRSSEVAAPVSMSEWYRLHYVPDVGVCLAGHGDDRISVQMAVFAHPQGCGVLWCNIVNFWDKLHLKFFPHHGSNWFHKRKATWSNLAKDLGIHPSAIRPSIPYSKRVLDEVNDAWTFEYPRCLTFPSVHISLLLAIVIAGAHGANERLGRLGDESARATFSRVCSGLLTYVKDMDFVISLLECPVWNGKVYSTQPCLLKLRGGVLDMSDLALCVRDARALKKGDVALLLEVCALEHPTLLDVLKHLVNNSVKIRRLFGQLVQQIGYVIEDRVCRRIDIVSGQTRTLRRDTSDLVLAAPKLVPIHDPTNGRHTSRELLRYMHQACTQVGGSCKLFSFTGPDAAKVHNDLTIEVAAQYNTDTGKVAILPPKVHCALISLGA